MCFSFPPAATKLAGLFDKQDHTIRLVGGWVRDTLRGVTPKDLDFATTARPDQIIEVCSANGLAYLDTGLKHGTIGIIIDQQVYEVTTLRVDRETDGRHASVEFTTDWEADAARRDFTINAMSVSLDGVLHDYFGGRDHLKARRVVFVGDPEARVNEDFLRILRYYRFRDRIGHIQTDPVVRDVFLANAKGLRHISGERIWMEFSKILSGRMLGTLLSDMRKAGIFEHISLFDPEIYRAVGARWASDNPITVLAALTAKSVAGPWRLSRGERLLLEWLQDRRNCRPTLDQLKDIATTGRYGREYAIELAALFGPSDELDAIRAWAAPILPVRGADLVDAGIAVGPEIGNVLRLLDRRWKDSDYRLSKDELIASLYSED